MRPRLQFQEYICIASFLRTWICEEFHSWDANITYQKHTRNHGRNSGLSAQLRISHCSSEIRGWGLQNVLQGHTWQPISWCVSSSRHKAPRLSFDCLQRWHQHQLPKSMKQSSKGTDTRSSLIKWPEHKMEGKKNSHQNTMPDICAKCYKAKEREGSPCKESQSKKEREGSCCKELKSERERKREREGGGSYSEVGLQKLKNTELGQMHKDKPAMFASLQ